MAALAADEPCLDDLESWSGVMPMSFRMSASCRALIPQLLATFFWHRLCTFVKHAAAKKTQAVRKCVEQQFVYVFQLHSVSNVH